MYKVYFNRGGLSELHAIAIYIATVILKLFISLLKKIV